MGRQVRAGSVASGSARGQEAEQLAAGAARRKLLVVQTTQPLQAAPTATRPHTTGIRRRAARPGGSARGGAWVGAQAACWRRASG